MEIADQSQFASRFPLVTKNAATHSCRLLFLGVMLPFLSSIFITLFENLGRDILAIMQAIT